MRIQLTCLVLFIFSARAIEFPIVLRDGGIHSSNVVKVPTKTEGLWLYFPQTKTQPRGVLVRTSRINGDQFQIDHTNGFPAPYTIKPRLAAGRLLVDKHFSEIRPVLIEPFRQSDAKNEFPEIITAALIDGPVKYTFDLLSATQRVNVEIVANRLGSKLDPVLRVTDANGFEVARADDSITAGRDAAISFISPHPGKYTLEVSDVANGTGDDYFFVLRSDPGANARVVFFYDMGAVAPFCLLKDGDETAPVAVEHVSSPFVPPVCLKGRFDKKGIRQSFEFEAKENQRLKFSTHTREFGSPCDAAITLYSATDKIIAESVGAGAEGAIVTNKFENEGRYRIEIREISRLAGPELNYWLKIEETKPGVALTTEVESVSFSKEGDAKIKIVCKRYDYDGAVNLE